MSACVVAEHGVCLGHTLFITSDLKPEKLHTSLLKLREGEEELNQWQRWMDYERLLCWSASQCVHFLYCSELVSCCGNCTGAVQYFWGGGGGG